MTFEPRPSTLARTLASNLVAGDPPDGLLDHDPDAAMTERRDPHDRLAAEGGQAGRGVDDPGVDDVGRDLDARHEVALLDDLAVEDREDLERVQSIDALELRDEHRDDAGRGGNEIETALVRPASVEIRAGDGLGQADRGVVLVQFPGLHDEHRHGRAGIGRSQGQKVVGAEPAALDPALTGDRQVAGEDPIHQPPGCAPTRSDLLDAHAWETFASDEAVERGLDRAPRVDGRHPRSIVATGVDVAADGHAIGGVVRGRRDAGR